MAQESVKMILLLICCSCNVKMNGKSSNPACKMFTVCYIRHHIIYLNHIPSYHGFDRNLITVLLLQQVSSDRHLVRQSSAVTLALYRTVHKSSDLNNPVVPSRKSPWE